MLAGPKPIVVVGSINTDLVVNAQRLPQRGETLPADSFATYQGGKGANQAVAAALLGASVVMIGKVGSDAFGEESVRQLQARGVDCTHVAVESGASGVALITVDAAGENTIMIVPGANAAVSPQYIESKREVIREAGMVLAQLEIPMESVVKLAEICEVEHVPLMLDPAPARKLSLELLRALSWITPNESEAAFYAERSGEVSIGANEAAAALLRAGVQGVVLKLGERGAKIFQPRAEPLVIDPFTVRTVDTTAAGDTFNGALAAALNAGCELAEAGRIASAAAAVSVSRKGAQSSMPTWDEVAQLLG